MQELKYSGLYDSDPDDCVPISTLHSNGTLRKILVAKRAKFLDCAWLVYSHAFGKHLKYKYEYGSSEQMRQIARLMRSSNALYRRFRKEFNDFFVPRAKALIAYTADKEFMNASCCAFCYAKFEGSGVHWYQVKFCDSPGCCSALSRYKVGCSHTDYDGEPWCSYCVAVVNVNSNPVICCTGCANIDYGRPCNKKVPYWDDDSIGTWEHKCNRRCHKRKHSYT